MTDISRRKRRARWIRRGVILAAVIALIVWALYAGLTVRHYEVQSSNVQGGASVRIVVVADLHSHMYGDGQQTLIDMISAQEPDLIALVGDIVDDDEPQDGACMFLEKVAGIAPTYYVSGNHEYWSGQCDNIKEMIAGYGITVLENERIDISVNGVRLCICGIDDPEVLEYTNDDAIMAMESPDELLERFDDLEEDTVNVLLAHRPERVDAYRQYDFDLVLSGHAHGGQVRIPLILNGLFAPDQGYFPEYAGGVYESGGQTMIVSRGLSLNARVPRVWNPPEVVVVDIVGQG